MWCVSLTLVLSDLAKKCNSGKNTRSDEAARFLGDAPPDRIKFEAPPLTELNSDRSSFQSVTT